MKDRPYEYIPTLALIILIENYDKMVQEGNFKLEKDFKQMLLEMEIRFNVKDLESKQITIDEYQRSRTNGEEKTKR